MKDCVQKQRREIVQADKFYDKVNQDRHNNR